MNTLKFCENNLNPAMRQLVEKAAAEFTNVDIAVEPCLGRCDTCAQTYFALANDELVTGDTTHLLFERVKNIIGERETAVDREDIRNIAKID